MQPTFWLPLILALFPVSSTMTAQTNQQLDAYLTEVYQNHTIPGFAAVVVQEDQIIYSGGFGKKIVGKAEKFTPGTRSAIGSLTKSITATAIMQLVEQGILELDAPVVRYLAEFRTANRERSDQITVRMLLNNTAGLKANPVPSFAPSTEALQHLLDHLKTTFLTKEPGRSYEYSNTDFSIAGLLISRVTHQAYEAYIQEHIFGPLQMDHSIANPLVQGKTTVAFGHHFGLRPLPAQQPVFAKSGEYVPAGSATQSTVEDLGNYLIALLNAGQFQGRQLLTQKSIDQLWSPEITFPGLSRADGGNGQLYHYGLGWMISTIDGRTVIHHGGSTGTMSSFTMIDPENKVATALLFNLDLTFTDKHQFVPHYTIANNILHLANGEAITNFGIPRTADETKNDFDLSPAQRAPYAGVYHYENGGMPGMNFGLTVNISSTEPQKATVLRKEEIVNAFLIDFINPTLAVTRNIATPETIRFVFSPKGNIQQLLWNGRIYRKEDDAELEGLQARPWGEHQTILLPKDWVLQTEAKTFVAMDPSNRTKIIGWVADSHPEADTTDRETYFARLAPKEKGLKTLETYGMQTWEKQSVINQNGTMVTSFRQLRAKQPIVLVLASLPEQHTRIIYEVVRPLLRELSR